MSPILDVLCLEPWLGGSHADLLAGWSARSAHRVETLGLAPRNWRWRVRSAPWELARRLDRAGRVRPDVLWVSDFVDLPALLGFLPSAWTDLPTVAYFHENQLAYTSDGVAPRDAHLAWSNVTTCLRADALAFNSDFHRATFAGAATAFLSALPRPSPRAELAAALERARVVHPGVERDAVPLGPGGDGPLRVLFPHRREPDKAPLEFLHAVRAALERGAEIELVLLGERGRRAPEGVAETLDALAPHVLRDEFVENRDAYLALLGTCDLVASTALHEFYGMAVLEALCAGCAPLLPDRLSYPEILPAPRHADGLYADGELAERLFTHARDPMPLRDPSDRARLREELAAHDRSHASRAMDALVEEAAETAHSRTGRA